MADYEDVIPTDPRAAARQAHDEDLKEQLRLRAVLFDEDGEGWWPDADFPYQPYYRNVEHE